MLVPHLCFQGNISIFKLNLLKVELVLLKFNIHFTFNLVLVNNNTDH